MAQEVPAADGVQARSGVYDDAVCPPHYDSHVTTRETPGDVDAKGKQISVKVRVCLRCTQEIPLEYRVKDDPAHPDAEDLAHSHVVDGS